MNDIKESPDYHIVETTHSYGAYGSAGIGENIGAIMSSVAQDLKSLLGDSDITESKAFLRSFIRLIEINSNAVIINYHLPLPHDEKGKEAAEVLSIVTPWWS